MIPIFETGELNYPDEKLDKPVKFSIKDLEAIASKTSFVDITNEHDDDVIGRFENFIVKDGKLWADSSTDINFKGKGWSPVFDTELVDMGDYYKPTKIVMESVGLSSTPRNKILYNTVSTTNTEADMGESALEKVIREKDELQKKIGVYESNEKMYRNQIKEREAEIERIKESNSDDDIEKLTEENKTLKEKADAYDSLMDEKRTDLIREIVGDDEKLAKEYESFSITQLESVLKTRKVSTVQKGVVSEGYPTDEGDDTHEDSEEEYTDEMFEAEFKASGL